MRAKMEGLELEGTVSEIAELLSLMKKQTNIQTVVPDNTPAIKSVYDEKISPVNKSNMPWRNKNSIAYKALLSVSKIADIESPQTGEAIARTLNRAISDTCSALAKITNTRYDLIKRTRQRESLTGRLVYHYYPTEALKQYFRENPDTSEITLKMNEV